MPLSRSRDYLSIGEVLENVRPDFPDVSISKIRFLESEGLIEPERTASGYRKFYDADVQRLRYILSLQRDHFLPLKVIKDRIASGGANGGAEAPAAAAPAAPPATPLPPSATAASQPAPQSMTEMSVTPEELASMAGLSDQELQGLFDFGILEKGKASYGGDDVVAAKAAAGLFRYGVEARHLKMYRNFAERERALLEQVVSPIARRKDPTAQREATTAIKELAGFAQQFRDAILRSSTRDLL